MKREREKAFKTKQGDNMRIRRLFGKTMFYGLLFILVGIIRSFFSPSHTAWLGSHNLLTLLDRGLLNKIIGSVCLKKTAK